MTSKDNVIGNDIKEFSQNFKKNLLDAWTWIIIIPHSSYYLLLKIMVKYYQKFLC